MIFQDLTKRKKSSTVEAYILWTLAQVFTPEKVGPLALCCFSVPITWPTALVPRHLKNKEPFYYTNCQVLNLLGICYRRRGISNALDYDFSIMSRGDKKFVKMSYSIPDDQSRSCGCRTCSVAYTDAACQCLHMFLFQIMHCCHLHCTRQNTALNQ